MTEATEAGAVEKIAIWRRPIVRLVGVAVVALAIGAAAGGSGSSTNTAHLRTLRSQNASLATQLTMANGKVAAAQTTAADAQTQVDKARSDAAHAMATAKKQVAGQNAAAAARLQAQAAALNARARALDARERVVRGEEQSYADNTIPGDGTFVVGVDVKPGVYHAAATTGCYWARLHSLDTSDINDNDNADGPVTVQIFASDKAFYVSGCSDFHKIG